MPDDLKKHLKLFENSKEKIKYKDIIKFIELKHSDEEARISELYDDTSIFAANLADHLSHGGNLKSFSVFGPQIYNAYSNFVEAVNILMDESDKWIERFEDAGIDDYYDLLLIWDNVVKDNSDPLDHMSLEEFVVWVKGVGVWRETYGTKNPLDVMTIKDFMLWSKSFESKSDENDED